AALRAVDPYNAVLIQTEHIRSLYRNGKYRKLVIIGFGKAAYAMASAMEDAFKEETADGVVITKYGHIPVKSLPDANQERIKIIEAGHPIPDENGVKGTEKIISLMTGADDETLVVCLISGGGSALFVAPYEGIPLDDKQKVTELLLKAGADIYELNSLRKHISRVKGGRLAEIAYPARIVSLILSDVIGDDVGVIASGPTAPDKTTFHDAIMVLGKYDLMERAPGRVLKVLQDGDRGAVAETPKEGNSIFEHVENIIIGSNSMALAAARQKAEDMGLCAEIISSGLNGEAREAGRWLGSIAKRSKDKCVPRRLCLISGGETTVTVKGNGVGGRNMELALAFALEADGVKGITLLSAGTDGTDGPTDAAGAVVDGNTIKRGRAAGLDPDAHLDNNDSYSFFKRTGELFITGPTGTNVMDIQIVMIE
ncbi:MAG: glycerate kinase, partial [Nitrospirae bacterium]|nr:glycerate kinase [Nitrospirota bacterium]